MGLDSDLADIGYWYSASLMLSHKIVKIVLFIVHIKYKIIMTTDYNVYHCTCLFLPMPLYNVCTYKYIEGKSVSYLYIYTYIQ